MEWTHHRMSGASRIRKRGWGSRVGFPHPSIGLLKRRPWNEGLYETLTRHVIGSWALSQFAGYYVALDKGWYLEENIDPSIEPGGPGLVPVDTCACAGCGPACEAGNTRWSIPVQGGLE